MINDMVFIAALGLLTYRLILICLCGLAMVAASLLGLSVIAALAPHGGRSAPEESNRPAPRQWWVR